LPIFDYLKAFAYKPLAYMLHRVVGTMGIFVFYAE